MLHAYPYARRDGELLSPWPVIVVVALVAIASWIANVPSIHHRSRSLALAMLLVMPSLELVPRGRKMQQVYPELAKDALALSSTAAQQVSEALEERGLMLAGQPLARIAIPPSIAPINSAMTHGYSHVDAYTSLFLKRPWACVHAMAGVKPPQFNNTSLSTEIYSNDLRLEHALGVVGAVEPQRGMLLFATNVPARAFLVHQTKYASNLTAVVGEIVRGFDFRRDSLIEEESVMLPQLNEDAEPTLVRILQHSRNELVVQATTSRSGLLVLSEAWYPGWFAEMNGQRHPMVVVNGWMRAVPVPAGTHEIRILFHQRFFWLGLSLSALAWVLLGYTAFSKWRARQTVEI